ncbi:uncharacterized protein AMSG_04952, partial [Thecamonas trahens ATCC 50062]
MLGEFGHTLLAGSLAFSIVIGLVGALLAAGGVVDTPDLSRCRCMAIGFGGPLVVLLIGAAVLYGQLVAGQLAWRAGRRAWDRHLERVYGSARAVDRIVVVDWPGHRQSGAESST